ncbi:deaminated glutathione amidase [Dickeya lacustris]|uniref:Deaminated glutathione amidase n=1 Tax=Dickeya lacustris TaxID=2259638 RepID=A0ABY8G636_9GAMM|nr:deaminated glutathione amidase [Dickeya lacustris]WFN55411.1 deaminated glutathione amidase [Dickeya lacustris]
MKVALGQFAVQRSWQDNAQTCVNLMNQAASAGADLLVLPEAVLARDNADPQWGVVNAQPINGPFVSQLLQASQSLNLYTVFTLHTPTVTGQVYNTLLVIRRAEVLAQYHKLHLYDAFSVQESRFVAPGDTLPPVVEIAGMRVGMMICYDLRFAETARHLALHGAEVLVVPAAWVKGAQKEAHWALLARTRALENTCYMVATGECGERNIGNSMVVDPMGVVIAQAAEQPELLLAELKRERIEAVRHQLPVLRHSRFKPPVLR